MGKSTKIADRRIAVRFFDPPAAYCGLKAVRYLEPPKRRHGRARFSDLIEQARGDVRTFVLETPRQGY
jgi:hypothetical protein